MPVFIGNKIICSMCNGTGYLGHCEKCHGTGLVKYKSNLYRNIDQEEHHE